MKSRGALCARYQLFKPLDYPAVFGTRAVLRSNHANKDSTLPSYALISLLQQPGPKNFKL